MAEYIYFRKTSCHDWKFGLFPQMADPMTVKSYRRN
jgi:hypothetical protein